MKEEHKVEMRFVLSLARKWLWILLLAAFIGGVAGLLVDLLLPKTYEADTTLYVSSLNHGDSSSLVGNQQAAKALASFPVSGVVLTATLQALGDKSLVLSQLSQMVTVANSNDTQFVTIQVRDRNPNRAARLSTEIARQTIIQYQATATDSSRIQFLQNEIDRIQTAIKNDEADLTKLQNQPLPYTSDQVASINQLTTSLGGLRQLYSQLENSYNSLTITQVSITQNAQVPSKPVGAGLTVAIPIGMLIGLIVIVGVIIFIEQTDDVLRSPTKVKKVTDLSTLAVVENLPIPAKHTFHLNGYHEVTGTEDTVKIVPVAPTPVTQREQRQEVTTTTVQRLSAQTKRVVVGEHRTKNRAIDDFKLPEIFLTLGVLLSGEGGQLIVSDKGISSLLITSPEDGDGKTLTASMIALGLARIGIEVVLVDANLRNPEIHTIFGVPNRMGLSSVLTARAGTDSSRQTVQSATVTLQDTHEPNLTILTGGPSLKSPAEALLSPKMTAILRQLSKNAFVVIDGPTTLTTSESVILADKVSSILMVVDAHRTTGAKVRQSLEILRQVNTNVLGVVLNRASNRD